MAWDVILSELWYTDLHDTMTSNTESQINNLWSEYCDDDNTVSYDDFRAIYECICTDKLILYSSNFKAGVRLSVDNCNGDDHDDDDNCNHHH